MIEFKRFIKTLNSDNKTLIESILSGYSCIFENISYPSGFDIREFERLPSFAGRKRYADQSLEKVGVGSARIVYRLDDEHVLKMAKNKKGIAQNRIESDGFLQQSYADIVASVIDSHADDLWIIAEKAKKLTKSRFKQIAGFPFNEFAMVLHTRVREIEGEHGFFRDLSDLPNIEEIYEDEFFNDIVEMIIQLDMETGDLERISSYGELNDEVVVTDAGLSKDVMKEHYRR